MAEFEVEMERLLLTLISAVYALGNGEEIDPAERLYLRYTELQLRQKLDGEPFPSKYSRLTGDSHDV